ncbi:hypothetical protein PoB_004281300 [Plakobranchus ocellatus]|uniref:Uncharacterized protein n=1 Tax=Plakobranchus ocellatus TaxID=259542 RepID=A0AAV4BAX1_9GAST|nr:hypothetical protein PoB_004281300 [Plakobranchus ocellatus]
MSILSREFTKLASSSSFLARPSISSVKLKFVIVLPPMLTVPSWSSEASVFSRQILKRMGESKQPCLTPTAALELEVHCTGGLVVETLYDLDQVGIDTIQIRNRSQCSVPNLDKSFLEIYEDMVEVLLMLKAPLTE